MVEEQHVIPTTPIPSVEYEGSHYKLAEDIDYETWEKKGSLLQAIHKNINWWIGDWIVFGERKFPTKYSQAVFITGKSEPTLRNCAWVCSVFPPEDRMYEDLSFTHYLEVAGIKDREERLSLLRKASEDNLSALALRQLRADEVRIPPVVPLTETASSIVPEHLQKAIEDFTRQMIDKCPLSEETDNTEVSVDFPWGVLSLRFERK